jgi:16S rRNA (cytosine1402-N4)-methyltransferase
MTMGALWMEEIRPVGHISVMATEIVEAIAPKAGCLYLDATLGAGGHTEALLLACPEAEVLGFDRDSVALEVAAERLRPFGSRVTFVHAAFHEIAEHVSLPGGRPVHGMIADLGVSSMQLDEPERGMSFRAAGPLDMRMDRTQGETAMDIIERLSQDKLADLIYELGEERASRRIARSIKYALDNGDLASTLDLRRAVVRAIGPRRVGGVDPATRTFQALRIAVNGEMLELQRLLEGAEQLVVEGGVLAVMSFHSLEDRMVKRAMQNRDVWARLWNKPKMAGEDEQHRNPRSRSAKLRAGRRCGSADAVNDVTLDAGDGEEGDS